MRLPILKKLKPKWFNSELPGPANAEVVASNFTGNGI